MPNRCHSNCFTFLTDGYAFIHLVCVIRGMKLKLSRNVHKLRSTKAFVAVARVLSSLLQLKVSVDL